MKVIYIAGPYRSKTEFGVKENIDAAEKAALFVWSNGGAAICPHKNTAFFGGALGLEDRVWLEGDLEILKRCDAVYALSTWRKSGGASEEIFLAHELGIPVFEEVLEDYVLCAFLRGSVTP